MKEGTVTSQKTNSGRGWRWAALLLPLVLLLLVGGFSVYEATSDDGVSSQDTELDFRDVGVDLAMAGENIPDEQLRVTHLDDDLEIIIVTILKEDGGIRGFCVVAEASESEAERLTRAFVADGPPGVVQATAWNCRR